VRLTTEEKAYQVARARAELKLAYAFSRAHSRLAVWAEGAYGAQGATISGVYREHFPQPVKERLRRLASMVSERLAYSRSAWRQAGKRQSTWQRLRQNIIRAYGRGFYG